MASRQEIYQRYREQEPQRRALQKQVKRSRNDDRVRRREWVAGDDMDELEAYDRDDSPAVERIRPRGERERRKANAARAAEVLEAEVEVAHTAVMDFEEIEAPPAGLLLGLVLETGSGISRVTVGDTRVLKCSLRGALTSSATGYTNVVAAGDRVYVSENGADGGVIEQVLPRRNALARPDVFYPHLQQVIAANVDQLLIVASWRNPASVAGTDRSLPDRGAA